MLGPVSVEFQNLLAVGVVRIEGAEHALAVAEEHQEVLALGARDLLEDALLGLAVDDARKDAVLDGVEDDGAVGARRRLLVQPRSAVVLAGRVAADVAGSVVEASADAEAHASAVHRAALGHQAGRQTSWPWFSVSHQSISLDRFPNVIGSDFTTIMN